MRFSVLTLVGPGETELARLDRMLRSLFRFSTQVDEVVLVDDAVAPRGLEKLIPTPSGVRITSLVHERRGQAPGVFGGLCMGLLQGLRYLSTRPGTEAVLKIDTDALVIHPFEDQIGRLLHHEPDLGTAGVVECNCDGSPRDWEPFKGLSKQLGWVLRFPRHKFLPRRITLWGHGATIRRVVWSARRHGYPWGEHAQGGSYLVSGSLIQRMARAGYLEHGKAWHQIFMSEDAMIGLYARACGLKNVHFGKAGEVFGIQPSGLPFRPQQLLDLGYSIVHSTKNNPESEAELFDFFCGPART